MSAVRVQRVYPHPIERVWRALTSAERLAVWLMPNDFEPRVGHRFTLTTEPGPGFDGVVRCEVLELDEPRAMTWSWKGGPIDTRVSFELREVTGGTELTVVQTGFRGAKGWLIARMLKIGSRTLYGKNLPEELERMAQGAPPDAADPQPDAACMSPEQSVLRRLVAWLSPRS